MTTEERIAEIEEEIKKTTYNKATQHHIGKLKAKLAQLSEDLIKKKSSGKKGAGFSVRKSGNATVALVGFPSVGKSTLLNQLTDAQSRVANYEFTTLDVIPGMMDYRGAKIQILDIPGIITGASSGKGRGKEILSIVRNSDLILILVDVNNPSHVTTIERELHYVGIRPNQTPPRASIQKTNRGGINVSSTVQLKRIDKRMIRGILNVYGIHNAQVAIHEDITDDQLIDVVMKNRIYIPSIIVLNKIDTVDDKKQGEVMSQVKKIKADKEVREIKQGKPGSKDKAGKKAKTDKKDTPDKKVKEGKKSKTRNRVKKSKAGSNDKTEVIPISAENGLNLDKLREGIFDKLDIIRIYTKRHGQRISSDEPLIMKRGSTVRDVCEVVHRGMIDKFKHAILSGKSAKFDLQVVGLNHVLEDRDVLTIVVER